MVKIRQVCEVEYNFLWDMLFECIHFPDENNKPKKEEFLKQPHIAKYLNDFGAEESDVGFAAVDENNVLLGAGWFRLFNAENKGYGYIDSNIPELSIAIKKEYRGKGIGSRLIKALVFRAKEDGYKALSLSVDKENAALQLYEREGFKKVELLGTSWTMKLDL